MGRTAIVAALATAAAIGIVTALQAPTGNGIVEVPAKHSAPSTSELPVAPGGREMDRIRASSSSDASVSQKSTTDHVQANTSTAIDPAPMQQRTDDDASVRATAAVRSESSSSADDSPVTTPATESSLSAREVRDIFVSGDACLVLGGDATGKARCIRAAAAADLIVTVPKTSGDSWAYGMEYELNRRLMEFPGADDPDALKRKAVQCNAAGCLVFVEGRNTWPHKLVKLAEQIRSDPDIAQLNDHGEWPDDRAWNHRFNDQVMLVLPR